MDYDVEREKQKIEEIRKVFREMFPLASEHDLPWAACHIQRFLKSRIESEIADGVLYFQQRVCRILCEVSPPKTRIEDMARIVVEKAKELDRMKPKLEDLKEITEERDEMLERFGEIGKLIGCNHTNDRDGRQKIVKCLRDTLDNESVRHE